MGARKIPAPWSILSQYGTESFSQAKKCQPKQRLFSRSCTSSSLLSWGQCWTSSDAVFPPSRHQTQLQLPHKRGRLEREKAHTEKSLHLSVHRHGAEVCQAPKLAPEPWEIPSLAGGCLGPAARTRACLQGWGACKILTEQQRRSGNAPNSSDGR